MSIATRSTVGDQQHAGAPAPARTSAPTPGRLGVGLGIAAAVGVVALLVAALWWHEGGGRWFVVETPSMGTALPVGTLVLTSPVAVADLAQGDVVTFRAPQSGTVYTHRVLNTSERGVTTQGDVNEAPDSGTIGQEDLVGLVSWHGPALGWVLRAVPVVVAGGALTWLLGLLLAPHRRRGLRLVGLSLSVALANLLLHPWVGIQKMSERLPEAADQGPSIDVISTGLLPIRAEQVGGGASAGLADGQVATLQLAPRSDGSYDVTSALDLGWLGWTLVVAACLVPMALSLLLGPSEAADPEPDTDRAAPPEPVAAAVGTALALVPRQPTGDDRATWWPWATDEPVVGASDRSGEERW